ncbi:hypothetical protein GW17_00041241 [Ensete ventricosum]|nr:hypothetical protein GW17_00041241 [Ensete ventricosum]RZR92586.1 hypothetical protein BHM03_00020894 [Ensete ventricosum]
MRLGTRQECVGSSPRVSVVCHNGTREFTRRRLRLARRLSGVAEKLIGRLTMTGAMELQPDDGPRSSLSIGSGFRRYSGISPKFARKFIEGIRKLAGNTPGDRWKKTIGLAARISEFVGLVGGLVFTERRSVVTPVCLKKEDSGVDVS